MAFSSGFTLENHTIAALERQFSFRLDSDPNWDHKHKIDFIVYAMPGFRPRPVGVQITQRIDAIEKMSEFLHAQSTAHALVDRALYIQVDTAVPLDEGGVELIALCLKQFQVDRSWQSQRVAGVHIHNDLTYQFFDIAARIGGSVDRKIESRAAVPAVRAAVPEWAPKPAEKEAKPGMDSGELARALMGDKTNGKQLRGILNQYRPARGFGMATGYDGNSYFVHIYSVIDPGLREKLAQYSGDSPVNMEVPIAFVDGGKTKTEAKYNEAKQVTGIR